MTELSLLTQELLALTLARADALVRADLAFCDHLIADEFSYTNSLGVVSNKAAYLQGLASGELRFQAQEVSEFAARVYGDTALVTCLLHDRASFRGQPFEAFFRTLQVYVRQPQGWRWVAGQTTEVVPPSA